MPRTIDAIDWLERELNYIERHDVITDDREPWEYDDTDYDPEPWDGDCDE